MLKVKRSCLLIIACLTANSGISQFVFAEFEPYLGIQYDKKIKDSELVLPEKGLAYVYGVNSILNFGSYFGLKLGIGVRREPMISNVISQLSSIITFAYINDRSIAFSAEFGMEFNDDYDFRTPFYFGIDQFISKGVNCTYRFRLPTFYDTNRIRSTSYNTLGFELGLKFNGSSFRKEKPITRHGNPFILR